jgi:hypothetical protein
MCTQRNVVWFFIIRSIDLFYLCVLNISVSVKYINVGLVRFVKFLARFSR